MSFDVVALFTSFPLEDIPQTSLGDCRSHEHFLTNTYFLYDVSFYRQEDGVVIGFPLTPVVANIYMEHFEQTAISTSRPAGTGKWTTPLLYGRIENGRNKNF
jgi:hypothetical protein